MVRVERKRATIMNADVVGYSQMMAQDAQGTIDGLLRCVALICGLVHEAGGRVIDAVGDNLSAEFESESAALYCALAVQRALAERQSEVGSTPIRVRIGLHTGDVLRAAKRRFGDVVNIAARLQTAALPDGVLVSDDLVEGLSPELRDLVVEVGPRQFKNIPYSVGTFAARV
jgi:class 3 adenylate cyclase